MRGLRLTVPRRYAFERSLIIKTGLNSAEAWDSLRSSEATGSFGFGRTREEWEYQALSSIRLTARAGALLELLRTWQCKGLVSVGVGTGMLEYLIKRAAPDIHLRCGDYAPGTVALLRDRFPECDKIEIMDLNNPSWAIGPTEVVLLHRVDMELRDDQWKSVFSDLRTRQCHRIAVVPCGLLTPIVAMREARTALTAVLHHKALRPAGFLRTSARMCELFAHAYRLSTSISTGDLPIWGLDMTP